MRLYAVRVTFLMTYQMEQRGKVHRQVAEQVCFHFIFNLTQVAIRKTVQ